uniref:Chromosome 3 open reading frame 33 n=1 Tax=Paramormyrops kingsleyae TaxID=1676925 RepID=A0A3B3QUF9_9TELE
LAIAGVVIIARSIKLTAKFGTASEIPAYFIERNVSLRGRVRRVTDKGLEVEHTPIKIPVLSSLLGKCRPDSLLDVRLAGVQVTAEGWAWLRDHLTSTETVWFRLIRRDDNTLDCLVSLGRVSGVVFNTCVNEELLRLGLGRTVPVVGLHHGSRLYWRVHRRLLRAEVQAERRGRGLWVQESFWKRTLWRTKAGPDFGWVGGQYVEKTSQKYYLVRNIFGNKCNKLRDFVKTLFVNKYCIYHVVC